MCSSSYPQCSGYDHFCAHYCFLSSDIDLGCCETHLEYFFVSSRERNIGKFRNLGWSISRIIALHKSTVQIHECRALLTSVGLILSIFCCWWWKCAMAFHRRLFHNIPRLKNRRQPIDRITQHNIMSMTIPISHLNRIYGRVRTVIFRFDVIIPTRRTPVPCGTEQICSKFIQ